MRNHCITKMWWKLTIWAGASGLSAVGSWTNWTPASGWVQSLWPVSSSRPGWDTCSLRKTPLGRSSISPWSSKPSPLHPKWSLAAGTSSSSDTCQRHPVVARGPFRPRCSAISTTFAVTRCDVEARKDCSPEWCTTRDKTSCRKPPLPWPWVRSRCSWRSHSAAASTKTCNHAWNNII